jgi:uncharacterized membrane protein YfcA
VALPPILAYLVFFQIALQTAMRLPTQYLKMFLGLLLMLVAIFFAFFPNRIKISPSIRNGLITGALSGIGAGFAGIGGPPLAIYFLSALNDKEKYIGTIQFYFTLTNGGGIFSRLLNGYELFRRLGLRPCLSWLPNRHLSDGVTRRITSILLKKNLFLYRPIRGCSASFRLF